MKNKVPKYYLVISHNKTNDVWHYNLRDCDPIVIIKETDIKEEIKIYLDLLNLHLYDRSVWLSCFIKESQFTDAMIVYYEKRN